MDGADLILIAGAVGLAALMLKQMKDNASFSDFMSASGASEDEIASSIVPVNGTDASQGATTGLKSISDWMQAIFVQEGNRPGDRAVRNNNPGNLKFAGQPGAVSGDGGFAVFPSLADGFAALNRQLTKWLNESPQLTLTQVAAKYLGQTDYLNPKVTDQGDPFAYANNVAKKLGVSPDQPIGTIFGG